jgi:hemerythrin-like metal-binding protein
MSFAKWDDSLSVGVEEIDEQHKEEIDLLNQLHEAKGEEAVKVFKELLEHTIHHFATEERYFDKFNYEKADAHKTLHKNFLAKARALGKAVDQGKPITEDTFEFIKNWLIGHVKFMDQQYTQCFNEHGLR